MRRYYNIKSVAQEAVKAHKKGQPLNPAGIKAYGLLFSYTETEVQYKGVSPVIGGRIMTTSAQALVAGINKVLDEGGEVEGLNAFRVRGSFQLPVKTGLRNATKKQKGKIESVDTVSVECPVILDDTVEKNAPKEPEIIATDSADTSADEAKTDEASQTTGEIASEVPVAHETETPSENTTSESSESGQVDWAYAKSLTKKELDNYAETLGVNLDARKSKAKMLDSFKEALNAEG